MNGSKAMTTALRRRHQHNDGLRVGRPLPRWMWGTGALVLLTAVDCCDNSNRKSPTGVDSAALQSAQSAATSAVAPAGTTPGDDADESTADLNEHHLHHHHGGFAMFIAMSADLLGTTPEQSAAITKIQADLRATMLPAHDAEKGVLLTLADGIASGTIDKGKVDAATAKLSAAVTGIHVLVADSLNQLHATLTPPQRIALVDKLEAHFQVWSGLNSPEGSEGDTHRGLLEKLTKELALSPDQVEKIRASITSSKDGTAKPFDRTEAEAHLKAFGTAFENDTFDAKTLTTDATVNAHIAVWGSTRVVHFYEAVTPVLTPEQRTKLADSLRRHANYKHTHMGT
jgi:Spy/CpxP family protein refolding chaperone